MKKIIVLVLFIVIALLGAPYLTGKVAENQIHRIVEELNQNPTLNGATEIVTYERSYFNTRSQFKYVLPATYQRLLNKMHSIDYNCEINHGITGINYQCNIGENDQYLNFIHSYLNGNDPLTMSGVVTAFGGLSHTISIDEIKDLKLEQGKAVINLAKSELTIDTDKNFSRYDIHGNLNDLNLNSATDKVIVDKIELSGDISGLEGGLYVGDLSFVIDTMELSDLNNTVRIDGFRTLTSADQDGDNLDSTTQVTIDEMILANAPFDVANNLEFELKVDNIDKDALIEYYAYSKEVQNQLANSNQNTSNIDPMEMVPIIENMLVEGFGINFDLSGRLDNNDNSISLQIELLDSVGMGDVMALAYAPQETLSKLNIQLSNSFNKDTVSADPKLASSVLNSPLFEETNNTYSMQLTLAEEIELNGETKTLEELQELMMSNVVQPNIEHQLEQK